MNAALAGGGFGLAMDPLDVVTGAGVVIVEDGAVPVAEQLAPSANFAKLGSSHRRLMVTVAGGRRQGAGKGGMDDWEWRTEAREGRRAGWMTFWRSAVV